MISTHCHCYNFLLSLPFVIVYIEDEISWQDLEEGSVQKILRLTCKVYVYLLLTQYCKTINSHIIAFQSELIFFLNIFPWSTFAPLPLPGLIHTDRYKCSSAICRQDLEVVSLPVSFQDISPKEIETGSFKVFLSDGYGTPSEADWPVCVEASVVQHCFQRLFFCQYIFMKHC